MSGFYGDVMRWWVGVVEEIATDIDKLGKVKVRIYGVHDDASKISIDDLPYAQCLVPTTEVRIYGVHDDAKKYLLMIYHMPNV